MEYDWRSYLFVGILAALFIAYVIFKKSGKA